MCYVPAGAPLLTRDAAEWSSLLLLALSWFAVSTSECGVMPRRINGALGKSSVEHINPWKWL